MPEDLSVLLAKLNLLSADFDAPRATWQPRDRPVPVPVPVDATRDIYRPGDTPVPVTPPVPPVHRHTCTRKEVSDGESEALLHEIKMLWKSKTSMLDWCRWLDNTINGRSPMHPVLHGNLQGIYSDERQTLLKLIYKIPYKFDLVRESLVENKLYYCTQYTTFSWDSRDVHCRVTIYDNVRSVLNEMSTWKRRFREALDSTQQVKYDSLYNEAKQSAEAWMSVAVPRMGTQALAYSRASQVSDQRRTLR